MDSQKATGEAVPMNKQEIVKDDGRALIYYTFPPEDLAPKDVGATTEAAHV